MACIPAAGGSHSPTETALSPSLTPGDSGVSGVGEELSLGQLAAQLLTSGLL